MAEKGRLKGHGYRRAAIRGCNFNDKTNAGVFTLNLNNEPSNSNYDIGFRASKVKDCTSRTAMSDQCRSAKYFGTMILTLKVKNKKQGASLVGNEGDAPAHGQDL